MAVVELIFKATDEASGVAQRLTINLREIGEGARRAGQEADGASTHVNRFFTGAAQAAAGFIAANVFQAITSGFGDVIGGAIESEEVMAQTEQAIRSTGGAAGMSAGQIADLASSLQKTTLFEDETVQSGENLLLTFTNIGQKVFPEATKTMLDMSQAMGQDVKSSAIQLGKALNDPAEGLTALTRIGVTFSDEQKNLVRSLQEAGDIEGAQAVILRELQREFGGSAEAAGKTMGGQLRILKNEISDTAEEFAKSLLPALVSVAEYAKGGADGLKQVVSFNDQLQAAGAHALALAKGYEDYASKIQFVNDTLHEELPLADGFVQLTEAQFNFAKSLEASGVSAEEASQRVGQLHDMFSLLDDIYGSMQPDEQAATNAVKELNDQILVLADHGELSTGQLQEMVNQLRETGDVQAFRGQIQQLTEWMNIDAQEAGRLSVANSAVSDSMAQTAVSADRTSEEFYRLADAAASAIAAMAGAESDFTNSILEDQESFQGKMVDLGSSGGGRRADTAKKTGDELQKIETETQGKIAEIDQKLAEDQLQIEQDKNDKILEMDRELTEAKKQALQELEDFIKQSNADLLADQIKNDAELIGLDKDKDAKKIQQLQAREAAEAQFRKRMLDSEEEARKISEGGDAGLAKKVLEIREKYAKEQEKVDEEYEKRKAELANNPEALKQLEAWHNQATEAIKNAENTEAQIAMQGAQQRAQSALDERQKVTDEARQKAEQVTAQAQKEKEQAIAEAEKKKAEIIAKARSEADGVTGAHGGGIAKREAAEREAYARKVAADSKRYMDEEEKQRQHLGQMLIDYIKADAVAHPEHKKRAEELTAVLEKEYGIRQSASDKAFGAMAGDIDDYLAHGGDLKTLTDSLEAHEEAAKHAQASLDNLKNTMRDQVDQEFISGKITVDQYRAALDNIPDKVKTILEVEERIKQQTSNLNPNLVGSNNGGYGGARASGGPVAGGVAYTVGEDGPELFVPHGSGTIIPTGATQQILGQSSSKHVEYHLHIHTNAPAEPVVQDFRMLQAMEGGV